MNVKTVREVSSLTGLSETTIYKHIKKDNLMVRIVNGIKMIEESSLTPFMEKYAPDALNHSKGVKNKEVFTDSNKSQNNESFEPLQNRLIDSLQSEISQLKKNISDLLSEKDGMYERLLKLEREQKDEIKNIHNSKDQQLKMYMELLKKQSENLLEARPGEVNSDENFIDITPTKEIMKTSKFFKKMKKKGYSDKKIRKIIKNKLIEGDKRFEVIDGNITIHKDHFTDL